MIWQPINMCHLWQYSNVFCCIKIQLNDLNLKKMHLVVINYFFFYFNSYNTQSTKWAKAQFLHRHYFPLKPTNRIYIWMNFILILSFVMLTKFNIKILILEKYVISLSYGCTTLYHTVASTYEKVCSDRELVLNVKEKKENSKLNLTQQRKT